MQHLDVLGDGYLYSKEWWQMSAHRKLRKVSEASDTFKESRKSWRLLIPSDDEADWTSAGRKNDRPMKYKESPLSYLIVDNWESDYRSYDQWLPLFLHSYSILLWLQWYCIPQSLIYLLYTYLLVACLFVKNPEGGTENSGRLLLWPGLWNVAFVYCLSSKGNSHRKTQYGRL